MLQLQKVASRYYNCSCLQKKRQRILGRSHVIHKCSDYILHHNNIFISNQLCKHTADCSTKNKLFLFTVSDPYLKQTFLIEGVTSDELKSVQPVYYSAWAVHTCGVYQPLQLSALKKYNLGSAHKEDDILDIRRLPKTISTKDLLSDMNATHGFHSFQKMFNKEDPLKQTVCGQNAPCCSVNKINFPQAEINGLACRTNKTLNFLLLDSARYKLLLKNIGINRIEGSSDSALLIIDLPMKTHFVMPENKKITGDSIGKFITFSPYLVQNTGHRT